MKRNIPIYFDNAIILSPAESINGSTGLNRLKVGVLLNMVIEMDHILLMKQLKC